MKNSLFSIIAACVALLFSTGLRAQVINGEHKYDGSHKNELWGYLMVGDNVITDAFY